MADYITNKEVALALGYDHEDPHIIEQIKLILTYVEPQIENYCHASLLPSEGDKVFNGTGNQVLHSSFYVREITAATYLDYFGDPVRDIPLESIILGPQNPRHGVYRYIEMKKIYGQATMELSQVWPRGFSNIQLTGKWGFPEVPGPVKAAIVYAVKAMFDVRDYNEFIRYESNLSRNVQFKGDIDILPVPSKKLLNHYRLMPIAFPEN